MLWNAGYEKWSQLLQLHTMTHLPSRHGLRSGRIRIVPTRFPVAYSRDWSTATNRSKYPPAEPVALRLLAPQRGLFATVRSKSKNKSKSLVALSSLPLQRQFKGGHTPGILKVLLPPRQSRGISLLD